MPPDSRRRDLDGFIASMKPYLDGIADAIGINDRAFIPVAFWGEKVRGGAVEVTITTCESALAEVLAGY